MLLFYALIRLAIWMAAAGAALAVGAAYLILAAIAAVIGGVAAAITSIREARNERR
jgi:predicted phage tail protein